MLTRIYVFLFQTCAANGWYQLQGHWLLWMIPLLMYQIVHYNMSFGSMLPRFTFQLEYLQARLEKTLESPLDCKEIQTVPPKENQSWIFIDRSDAEAETLILWPSDAKNWLIGKDPDAGKDWRQEEKGTTEDSMVGWHHQLDRHEFE